MEEKKLLKQKLNEYKLNNKSEKKAKEILYELNYLNAYENIMQDLPETFVKYIQEESYNIEMQDYEGKYIKDKVDKMLTRAKKMLE